MSERIKIRITGTFTRVIEIDPEWYEADRRAPAQIIEHECAAATDDPTYFNDCDTANCTGEVIDG